MGMFNELRMSTHGGKMFPKTPRPYSGIIPQITSISSPTLTDLGKSLAGLNTCYNKRLVITKD